MSTLEAQLAALTQEFVGRIVEVIRNASFAEVASLSPGKPSSGGKAAPRGSRVPKPAPSSPGRRAGRQTAARRAEVGERVMAALRSAKSPMGVRALSEELGVAPDVLAVPLRELRAASKVRKHGEKRSTTYSAA
ncbi:MAG TPA: hypothetical protein VGG39_24385 [Polyangiaceae bacterium]|jgi:hypothetical protein